MLSAELEYALNEAFQRARDAQHEFITVEHLLLALIREGEGVAARVLQDLGADHEKVRKEIMKLLGSLHEQGITIIIVTHDPEVGQVAQRRITLRDGLVESDEVDSE